jgi:hypothetical protein
MEEDENPGCLQIWGEKRRPIFGNCYSASGLKEQDEEEIKEIEQRRNRNLMKT